ncbi:MAG TPA: GNAT family N-acetyltransferase [Candidatus Angelobacter sp.]|nr:GNAT family N-acetyltransferase [Candidatus Angelobacter sp.]
MNDPQTKPPLSAVELLTSEHDLSQFDCGRHVSLTDWLKRFARMNQSSGDTRTYVVHRHLSVVGYYSLAPGSISRKEATARARKSAPEPIPVVLLARLAVDQREQGLGLGSALLKDALQRAYAGAEIIGGRAVLVHAIDAAASAFYRKFGFESCPGIETHLMLLMKDLRATLAI